MIVKMLECSMLIMLSVQSLLILLQLINENTIFYYKNSVETILITIKNNIDDSVTDTSDDNNYNDDNFNLMHENRIIRNYLLISFNLMI